MKRNWLCAVLSFAWLILAGCSPNAGVEDQSQVVPEVTVQPVIQIVKPGQTATFTVVATGTDLHYQWKRNGANTCDNSPSCTTPPTTMANNGEKYLVVVSNDAGSVASVEVTLSVNQNDLPPVIQTQPHSITVTAGKTATFTVAAFGSSPLRYQWRKNDSNIGENLPSYTTPPTTQPDSGAIYTVVVSNSVSTITSDPATLTVVPPGAAPTITTQPHSVAVTEGATANFTVVAAGTAPLRYQWRKKEGNTVVGSSSPGLTITNAATAQAGIYTVTVTNDIGSVTSQEATLSVTPPTVVTVDVSPANVTLEAGVTRTFTASVSGSSNSAVSWTCTGGTITNDGRYTAPAQTGNYRVRATSQANTSAYAEVTIVVVPVSHEIRVLFLGNSFTNEHHLSAQVMGMARAAGLNFYAEEYTIGASDLRDHWEAADKASLEKIQEGGWDFVVLQPFWHAYGDITKEQELVYAQYFDAAIKAQKQGARTVVFCTWALGSAATGKPSDSNLWDYNNEERADLGNLWMAQQLGALPVRVGDAWQESFLQYPAINLYASDTVHPSAPGHFFTAALFLAALTGTDPTGNTYRPSDPNDVVSNGDAAKLLPLAWVLNNSLR